MADDMEFTEHLRIKTVTIERRAGDMSASLRTARCRQIKRAART